MKLTDVANDVADAVLSELYGRGGFDAWWDGIDEETATEIMDALRKVVTKTLREHGAED